jgi:hypothetical protein
MRTFSFFIHTTFSAVPALVFEAATDDASIRRLAEIALAESPSRLLVEVREEDRLVFSIDRNGVAWRSRQDSRSNCEAIDCCAERLRRSGS